MEQVEKITLIKRTPIRDSIGEVSYTETEKTVYCRITNVGQTEWFQANRSDIQATYRVLMYGFEYEGEELCELHGTRYRIYRVFVRDALNIELYLEKRVGDER